MIKTENIASIITFISTNWAFFLFIISVIAVFIGRFRYGVSLFQPLEEISYKQKEYKRTDEQNQYKTNMVLRHLDLGNSFLNICELKDAKIEFQNALTLDPSNKEAQLGLLKAQIFEPILKKDFDPGVAEKRLELVLKENPKDKHALMFLGNIYTLIDHDKALEYYKQALSDDEVLPAAYVNMSYIYKMKKNDPETAFHMIEKALALSKWDQNILNNFGYLCISSGDLEKAITHFETLLSLNKHYLLAYWNLSRAYRLNDDDEKAYKLLKQLIPFLDDIEVTSLKKNASIWLFETKPNNEIVQFNDLSQKRCYSYYSAALTCHLIDKHEETQTFIKKAKQLNVPDDKPAKIFLLSNIYELENKRENLANKLEEFKELYLSNGNIFNHESLNGWNYGTKGSQEP